MNSYLCYRFLVNFQLGELWKAGSDKVEHIHQRRIGCEFAPISEISISVFGPKFGPYIVALGFRVRPTFLFSVLRPHFPNKENISIKPSERCVIYAQCAGILLQIYVDSLR